MSEKCRNSDNRSCLFFARVASDAREATERRECTIDQALISHRIRSRPRDDITLLFCVVLFFLSHASDLCINLTTILHIVAPFSRLSGSYNRAVITRCFAPTSANYHINLERAAVSINEMKLK